MSAILEKIKEFPYMTKTQFQGKAKFLETGRMRSIDFYGNNLEECKEALIAQGYGEPFEITEMPPEPATESQKTFAADLRLSFPDDISKRDMTFLITKSVEKDGDPKFGLLEYAANRGMNISEYIGKKALYDVIFYSLEGRDKVAFFLFCIYRYCSDDRHDNLDSHPRKDVFYALAEELVYDSQFIRSMNNYEGSDIRFFGTLQVMQAPNRQFKTQGGSTNTIAYKKGVKALQAVFPSLPFRTFKSIQGNRPGDSPRILTSDIFGKWIFFFVCLFLGMLGIHKFVQGKSKLGLLYLFTLGLFGIGWIFDIVVSFFDALHTLLSYLNQPPNA